MPLVYSLLITVLCWMIISSTSVAQAPAGAPRLSAPVTRLVAPRGDVADSVEAEPADDDTDSATENDSAEPTEIGGVESDAANSASPSDNAPATSTNAATRKNKPAVGAAPLRSFDMGPSRKDAHSANSAMDDDGAESHDENLPAADSSAIVGRHAIRLAPATFHDVQPGVSTLAQLEAKWGQPVGDETRLGTGQRTYTMAPFEQVVVTLEQGKVISIAAQLAEPLAVDEVTGQFVPEAANPVEVLDDRGQALGLAFPERGVALAYAPDSKDVSRLLFDPIDYESFLMRAERNQLIAPQQSLADVEFVLQKHAKHAPARALAAQIYFQAGQLTDAATQIDAALATEPANAAYLLTKAEILAESGDFTTSKQTCERVLAQAKLSPELKGRAHCLLGDFLANGADRDYKRAIEQHLAAIQVVQPLANDERALTRRAAKHVLVTAQLGVANDIAWGFWQQKDKVVPKWLVAAHRVAEDMIDQEGADESLHLLVLRRALAASAGTQGKLDPVMWTKEAVKTARRLIDTSDDAWRRGRLEWELGLALYDALQADQARGYHDHALSNSSLVVKYLESALRQRQETPHGAYLLGRLYFRVGVIHAVELNDHRTAVTWFQKALPLLERPLPTTALADGGRLGESFVSVGISYWEIGRRDEAMRLTQHGISLVMQAVKDRSIDEEALVVPYSNLAFMHRELGNAKQAEGYAEMATRLDGTRRQ